jgi:hypothetical protein
LALRELLLVDQHVRILEHALHVGRVRDEVRAQVPLVELHALEQLDFRLEALAFLDRDHAVLADLLHRLGDDAADLGVLVGAARADLRDLLGVLDRVAHVRQLVDDRADGHVDAALDLVGVRARDDVLQPLLEDGLRVDRRRRRAVARILRGLAGDLLDHLGAHVLKGVVQFDLLRDGHAVLRHRRRAERLLEDHDAAGRAERDLDRLGELLDPGEDPLAGVLFECDLLRSHDESVPCL